ncbi:hypothetical protein ACTXOR_08425 [Arthrobacter rhombi]|uniref:Uncharacterized protein n=1 Tax=Arthrobacter rhombi TaxID=71253 RepID=A0A1R4GVZ3_9MICC|nr:MULTISPECIES: hypothetical protein [Micrococcaceae]PCC26986.1 hypothetical protein CIK75_00655 [Glutamicibacter sp. BW78]SJM72291.1 hypothetical protein FM101_14745 [Arthrobacter rhombi]
MENPLPRAYQSYLEGAEPAFLDTVRPVMQESVAEGEYGVLVRFLGTGVQALVSETVPFGEVRELHHE